MVPSIEFKYCFYPALSEQKVGYVSFARVFFFCQLCRESEKKNFVQLLLFILTEFYKNF